MNCLLLLFFLREREREGKRETLMREGKHQPAVSCTPPNGDLANNAGMCPDQDLNWQLFGAQDDTPAK